MQTKHSMISKRIMLAHTVLIILSSGISAALSTSPHVDQYVSMGRCIFLLITIRHRQTQDNLLFWRPADAQVVPESFPSLSFPTMVNGMCRDDTTSVSHTAYHPSVNDTFADSRETSNTPRGPWPNSDRQSLSPIIEPGTRNLSNHLNANQSLPSPSLTMHFPYPGAPNDQNAAEPFVPRHLPSHYPSPLHWFPHHPRSIEPPEPDTHFRFVPPQDPTISSCRRRAARAFEFGGVCLDEEEFVKSLTEASGRLDVFQCRWEENHSPCHLWIKGDKSCINVHIQRWHGGQPGGDKLEVECHWAGCEATMLKESIARHIVSIHLGEKWECQGCGKEAARYDVHRRHTVRSNLEVCRTSGALTTYSADVWVIDAHAALDSGARLRADV